MASTNRRFDDGLVLKKLEEMRGLQLGNYDTYPSVSVDYDPPTMNGIQGAYVEATLRWRVSGVEADEILEYAKNVTG
jgi:hypothetical protein